MLVAAVLIALLIGHAFRRAAASLPAAAAIAGFAAIYGLVRATLVRYSTAAREGWLGALPVARATRERSAAVLAGVAGGACCAIALGAAAAAGAGAGAPPIVATLAIGFGASLAAWLATRSLRGPQAQASNAASRRERARAVPRLAFAPTWPRSPAYPNLALWQRVRSVARWRSAGRAWQLGALALALPRNTAWLDGVAFIVSVAALLWWIAMATASRSAQVDARALLAALAHDPRALARASLRYPSLATAGVAAVVALALGLAQWLR